MSFCSILYGQLHAICSPLFGRCSQYLCKPGCHHLDTAGCSEMEAYFYLRSLGYRIVAKNYRTPHEHGKIDMIGWDDGVLCFIQLKTLTKVTLAPPEMAVDAEKKKPIRSVARPNVRRLQSDRPPPCRFDVVSVVLGDDQDGPTIDGIRGLLRGRWHGRRPNAKLVQAVPAVGVDLAAFLLLRDCIATVNMPPT